MTKRRARGTGTIERRLQPDGSIKFYPRLPPGCDRGGLGMHDTYDAAEQALDEGLKLHAGGLVRAATELGAFGEEVLNRRELAGYRNTDDDRRTWKRTVLAWECSTWPIEDVARKNVREWLRGLRKKGLADSSITNALNLLRAVFYEAEEDEIVEENPCADLRVKKKERDPNDDEPSTFLTLDELNALFWSADLEGKILISFAAFTGMREGEIFAAPPALVHLDDEDPHVVVRFGKPGKPTKTPTSRRKVPLLGPALEAARAWQSFWVVRAIPGCRHTPEHGRFFFPTITGRARQVGHPFGKTNERWDSWLASAGITRNVRFHDLRHTCATMLLSGALGRKWSKEEVQKMLGHASITTTERYARLLDNVTTDAARETRGPSASSLAAISCDLPTVSQLPMDPALSARFWSRLRDLNSRPTVYEKLAEFKGNESLAHGVGLALAVLRAGADGRASREVVERACDVLDAAERERGELAASA